MTNGFISDERLLFGPWQALERAVVRLLPHLEFKEVQLIGGPGDMGGDVLAVRNSERWVFQVKYTQGYSVGANSITEAVNAARFYKAQKCVVVTNSNFAPETFEKKRKLDSQGVTVQLWDGTTLTELFERIDEFPPAPWPLHPYQNDAVNSLQNAFLRPEKYSALIVMATGLGKTYVVANFISELTRGDDELSVLVLAHVKELVHQLEQAFWPHLSKYVATHIWTGNEKPSFNKGITFATVQSISSQLHHINPGQYKVVVIDEAHHTGSETYRQILKHLAPEFLIGLTATPWRADKFLLSDIFGSPVYSISIVQGMDQGYLAEVDYRMLVDNINWEEFKSMSRRDYSIKELNSKLFIPTRDQAVVSKIKEHWQQVNRPKGIVFCRSIDHAQRINLMLNAAQFCNSVCISSQTPRRERDLMLHKFREGELGVLVTVDLLNEGIDVPEVNLIVFLRVTHSRRIFIQQLGRGLRLSKGKSNVKVLDFVSDIRRIAAGLELEEEHEEFKRQHPEILNIRDKLICFTNDKALSFFKEWLADIANVQDVDEKARLEFPPP